MKSASAKFLFNLFDWITEVYHNLLETWYWCSRRMLGIVLVLKDKTSFDGENLGQDRQGTFHRRMVAFETFFGWTLGVLSFRVFCLNPFWAENG